VFYEFVMDRRIDEGVVAREANLACVEEFGEYDAFGC